MKRTADIQDISDEEREWNYQFKWFDFSFGKEEGMRTWGWRCWCTELRLEDSPLVL